MPSNKSSGASKSKNQPKKAAAGRKTVKKEKSDARRTFDEVANQLVPYILLCAAVFIAVCFIFPDAAGLAGHGLNALSRGLFGAAGLTLPLFIINIAIFYSSDVEKHIVR